jgi:hypothetical protein
MDKLILFVTSPWFAWLQVGSCLLGSAGFAAQRNFPLAWTWTCYAFANLGFVALAGGFK